MYHQDWSPWDGSLFVRQSTSRAPGQLTSHSGTSNARRFPASSSSAHFNNGVQQLPVVNGSGPIVYRRVVATTFMREPTIGEVLRAGGRLGTVVTHKGSPEQRFAAYGSPSLINGSSSSVPAAKRVKTDLSAMVGSAGVRHYSPYYAAGNNFATQQPYIRVVNSYWPPPAPSHLQAAYQRKKLPNGAQKPKRTAKHTEALLRKLEPSEDDKRGRPSSCARLVPFDEWRLKKERGLALGEQGHSEARSRRKRKKHLTVDDTIVLPLDAEQWTPVEESQQMDETSTFKIPTLVAGRRKAKKGKEQVKLLQRGVWKRFPARADAEETAVVEEYAKSGLNAEEVRFLRTAWSSFPSEEWEGLISGVEGCTVSPPEWVERGLERLPAMDAKVQPIRRHYAKAFGDENFHHFRYTTNDQELRDVMPLPAGCARAQPMFRPHKTFAGKSREERAGDAPYNGHNHFIRRRLSGLNGIAAAAASAIVPSEILDGRLVHHEIQGQCLPLTLQPTRAVVVERLRKKRVKFARSTIHGWGLFAMEPIPADEVVIEYIGELVRHSVADVRERGYRAKGIGSDYMFRMDNEWVVDATRRGNYARFINHCCRPNCFGKVNSSTTSGEKRITIYSRVDIETGDELTYDYKFEAENNAQEHVECLCGVKGCKRKLN